MQEIFRTVVGSRLFGCYRNDSDWDTKAVHIPSVEDILFGKNDPVTVDPMGSGEDFTSFSLQRYVQLLNKMETNSIEMLFARTKYEANRVWRDLYQNRDRFLCSNKGPILGFANHQLKRHSSSTEPDWKGLYHAHRVLDEGIELWETGKLVFPLYNCDFYTKIRAGKFTLEKVLDTFEDKLHEFEALKTDKLPEAVDKEYCRDFVYRVYGYKVFHEFNSIPLC